MHDSALWLPRSEAGGGTLVQAAPGRLMSGVNVRAKIAGDRREVQTAGQRLGLTSWVPGCSLENTMRTGCSMLPLYSARLSDLKPGDFVIVECTSCGRDGLIHPAALPSLGLGPNERIVDLAPRLRCRGCDARGKAVISIKWAVGAAPST